MFVFEFESAQSRNSRINSFSRVENLNYARFISILSVYLNYGCIHCAHTCATRAPLKENKKMNARFPKDVDETHAR